MSASDEAKARGNALFGQKKYTEAITAYAEGLALVRGLIIPRAQSHLCNANMCALHGLGAHAVTHNAHNT